jgi:8-oxo-dGTP pyrophosphatase MutT (NUDIX family)
MSRKIQHFQVALKALIVRDGRLLVLRERNETGLWELPGGRIEVGEESAPHAAVLLRELREELGASFRCRIGAPIVTWMRPLICDPGEFGFLVGYVCAYESGEIELSDEHSESRWIQGAEWDELQFAPGYGPVLEAFKATVDPDET